MDRSSGTPLAQKLGIGEGFRIGLINPPDGFVDLLEPLPEGAVVMPAARGRRDMVVAFLRDRRELESKLDALKRAVTPDGAIWIVWPEPKSEPQPTSAAAASTALSESMIRDIAQPLGLVDSALRGEAGRVVDDGWLGLRLVVRTENRR